MKIGCVILAAGQSRRFGSNKLLVPLAGIPLLAHTLRTIPRPSFSSIVAVVSHPEVAHLCSRYGIQSHLYDGGPQSQSIRLGLSTISSVDGCLFVMGDQPLCQTDTIERMVDVFSSHPLQICRLSYASQTSSPTLFPAALFPALMHLTGEQGGMSVVGSTPIHYVEANGPHELWDADTPYSFHRLQQYLTLHPKLSP